MKNDPFPVRKSFLCDKALARTIEAAYGLSEATCQLITASLRDVYLVASSQQRHAFYIYRYNQRTPTEIFAEWKFVDFLYAHGVPVAPAVPTKSGDLLLAFDTPEGTRYGVLATFIDGKHLRQRPSIQAVRTYGRLIAQIHTLADVMPYELTRPTHDWELLINQSVVAFDSIITAQLEDKAYLHKVAATLYPKMAVLSTDKPYYGLIHGDAIRANAQVSDDGHVTVLDFDLCGFGWRVYDVASYLLVVKGLPDQDESERAFLGGYQEIRSLTSVEQDTLPLFEAVRAVFDIGVKAANVHHWGSAYLHTFLGQSLERLKQCMKHIQ